MANADKGNIEVINGSIGDLIFRIETLTSDRDTIKVCVRAANELTAMTNHINSLTESNTRLQSTYDHVEEINLRYAELIQSLQNDRKLADMAWTDNQAALNKQAEEIKTLKQELETIKSCKHMNVKIHSRLYRPSTREEPAEYEYKAECKDCGELFSADDVDEWAEVEE